MEVIIKYKLQLSAFEYRAYAGSSASPLFRAERLTGEISADRVAISFENVRGEDKTFYETVIEGEIYERLQEVIEATTLSPLISIGGGIHITFEDVEGTKITGEPANGVQWRELVEEINKQLNRSTRKSGIAYLAAQNEPGKRAKSPARLATMSYPKP